MKIVRKINKLIKIVYYRVKENESVYINGEEFTVNKRHNFNFWNHFTKTNVNEPEIFAILKDYLKPGSVFFDIGAFVGSHTLYASKIVGENGKVFSFEPNPYNAVEFKNNMILNHVTNVFLSQLALGDTIRRFDFYLPKRHGDKTSLLLKGNNINAIYIEEKTLQFFMDEHKVIPDLIKIDVEGYEYEIFKGSEAYFINNMPNTICELHLKLLNSEKIEYLFSLFNHYSKVLVVSGIDLPHLKKWDEIKLEDIYQSKRSTITIFLTN